MGHPLMQRMWSLHIRQLLIPMSPSDPGRSNATMTDSGFLDPLATPFTDDSGGQYLWEYLSWSDNNLWPGIVADIDGRNDTMALLTPDHDKGPKYGDQPAYFDPMPESGYGVHTGFYY